VLEVLGEENRLPGVASVLSHPGGDALKTDLPHPHTCPDLWELITETASALGLLCESVENARHLPKGASLTT
jgi:hypothetical protein